MALTITPSGIPGGSSAQIQYNNSGAFGGTTNATSDGTTATLTSPKVVTGINDTNANSMLAFTPTTSAVDGFTMTNAATGSPATVTLSATGTDPNIHVGISPKGTAAIIVPNSPVDPPNTAQIRASDNTGLVFHGGGNQQMGFVSSSSVVVELMANGNLNACNTTIYGWSSAGAGSGWFSNPDTGLLRNAAGVVEANTGVAGAFCDTKSNVIDILNWKNTATLGGTELASVSGTRTLTVYDLENNPPHKGAFSLAQFTLRAGEFLLQFAKLIMNGNTTATLTEDAMIVLTDLVPTGSISLSGT